MQVETKKEAERQLFTGVGECKVMAINPTRSQLNKLLNYTPEEEQQELDYTKDGVDVKVGDETINTNQVFVDFWLQELKTQKLFKLRFIITNHNKMSSTGKLQYISQHGMSSYVDSEENLTNFFTTTNKGDKRSYRKAKIGEENFYHFLAKWINADTRNITNSYFLENEKKFWSGNFSELQELVEKFEKQTILVCFGVKTKEAVNEQTQETEVKTYQTICNKFFCPGKYMKSFKTFANVDFQGLDKKNYDLMKFVEGLKDTENGFKDFFTLTEIHPYDPTANLAETDKVVSEEDSSY